MMPQSDYIETNIADEAANHAREILKIQVNESTLKIMQYGLKRLKQSLSAYQYLAIFEEEDSNLTLAMAHELWLQWAPDGKRHTKEAPYYAFKYAFQYQYPNPLQVSENFKNTTQIKAWDLLEDHHCKERKPFLPYFLSLYPDSIFTKEAKTYFLALNECPLDDTHLQTALLFDNDAKLRGLIKLLRTKEARDIATFINEDNITALECMISCQQACNVPVLPVEYLNAFACQEMDMHVPINDFEKHLEWIWNTYPYTKFFNF